MSHLNLFVPYHLQFWPCLENAFHLFNLKLMLLLINAIHRIALGQFLQGMQGYAYGQFAGYQQAGYMG